MPFCTTCGAAYAESDRFCSRCGRDFDVPQPPNTQTLYFSCDGRGADLLVLYLKTLVLSIVTLGIYSFWGKAEIRRYLYHSVRAGEDRFQYHGTGWELLRGWLKALGILVVFYCVVLGLTLAEKTTGSVVAALFFYAALILLAPMVHVGRLRYRMSRTSLRGIHFQSRATFGGMARVYYKGIFLTTITIGFYFPWFINNLSKYVAETTWYGDQPFGYDGDGRDMFKWWVIALLLTIPTLYMSWVWFYFKRLNYVTSHTTFGSGRLRLNIEFWPALGLLITNVLLVIFTLGIGAAWARLRWMDFECDSLWLENFGGFGVVGQRVMKATATGEGMAALLDMDSDIGGGLEM